MNAVNRTGVHACGVFHIDTGLGYYVGHIPCTSIPMLAPGITTVGDKSHNPTPSLIVQWESPELCLPVTISIFCSYRMIWSISGYPGSNFHDGSPCLASNRSRNQAFFSRS